MAYPRRFLDDDESVTVDVHPHWWFLVPPAMTVVVAIGASILTITALEAGTVERRIATAVSLAALLASALWLISRYARWSTTSFVVTNRRVIFRTGLVAKRGVEIPLDRVNTVHLSQGLFERMVGVGDLMVESGGESGQQRFTDIREPGRVQRAIHAEMEARERRRSTGDGVVDVAAQLERLDALRERGTLTDDEFERQKRRLLGQ